LINVEKYYKLMKIFKINKIIRVIVDCFFIWRYYKKI